MDKQAVRESTDDVIEQLGLNEKGHLICLKLFCINQNNEAKSSLASSIKDASKERLSSSKRLKRSSRSINFGWKHFDSKKRSYCLVRSNHGGGSRCTTVTNDITIKEILTLFCDLFFPEGNSYHGNLNFINVSVGNYKGEVIEDESMTIMQYGNKHKLSKIRLYLLSKHKSISQLCNNDTDSDFDPFESNSFTRSTPVSTRLNIDIAKEITLPTSTLVGTSEERATLSAEIDAAFAESLRADQDKMINIPSDSENEEELQVLKSQRSERLVNEPELSEPHCTVTVRHLNLGNKSRIFPASSSFVQVYDWVGSLSLRPKFYTLSDYNGNIISPEVEIFSGVFNMAEAETILMSSSGTIGFTGFSTKPSTEDSFIALDKIRITEREKLNSTVLSFEVSRPDIYDDMLNIYKKRGTISHVTSFNFKKEDAYGDGVTRDCYAEFFQRFVEKMEGNEEKVPAPDIDDDELEVIGRIITHAFIQYSIFPLSICKSALKNALFHNVNKDDLFYSFLKFTTSAEAELINNFPKYTGTEKVQGVIDILHEYNVFEKPKQENIRQLCIKAANVALIRRPFLAVKSIITGMGIFWEKVTPGMIDSLYEACIPTASKLISQIQAVENSQQDQKITTWLYRYIRSCSKADIMRLVRFITGSTSLLPDTIIKVQFC